jgi:hypothetical protein
MAKSLGGYQPEQMRLKITLLESKPKIWRRVEVNSGLTLHELHYVIQCVFEWDDDHLYHFLVPPGGKLTRKAMREATRYHVLPPDPVFGDEFESDRPADETMLGQVFTGDCKQIVYEYDFGDSWQHLVKLEKRTPGGDQEHLPVCLAGENAAPLDDMGGIYGYYEWLEAMQNPGHGMHAQAVEWLGADFDPARFDLHEVNKRLSAEFRPVQKEQDKRQRRLSPE